MTGNEAFAALVLVGIVGLIGPWATLVVLVVRARRRDQRAAMRRVLGLDLDKPRRERPDGVLYGWRP